MNSLNLTVKEQGKWIPLPGWAGFLVSLGSFSVKEVPATERTVISLALPTSSYAALLIALGAVAEKSRQVTGDPDSMNHFEKLCNLEPGTPLVYRKGKRQFDAEFDGVAQYHNETYIRIRVEKERVDSIYKEDALNVEIRKKKYKIPKKQKGRVLSKQNNLASQLLMDLAEPDTSLLSRIDCSIVGSEKQLKQELDQIEIAVQPEKSRLIPGKLSDVLMIKNFIRRGKYFRSEIMNASGREAPDISSGFQPSVVVFDGATSFLKWNHCWKSANTILVIDRVDPRFQDAADLINQIYVTSRSSEVTLKDLPALPKGMELMAFREKIK